MDRNEFLRAFEQVVEAPSGSLNGSEQLDGLEKWDSVAMVSLMGVVNERSEARLSPRRVAACSTVEDIFHSLQSA